jgi:hypothetical protein
MSTLNLVTSLIKQMVAPPKGMVLYRIPKGYEAECCNCYDIIEERQVCYTKDDDDSGEFLCKTCAIGTNGMALLNAMLRR